MNNSNIFVVSQLWRVFLKLPQYLTLSSGLLGFKDYRLLVLLVSKVLGSWVPKLQSFENPLMFVQGIAAPWYPIYIRWVDAFAIDVNCISKMFKTLLDGSKGLLYLSIMPSSLFSRIRIRVNQLLRIIFKRILHKIFHFFLFLIYDALFFFFLGLNKIRLFHLDRVLNLA